MTTWNEQQVSELFAKPFIDLVCAAQAIHKQHFNPHEMELCTLLSIKTGACPEDCAYCSQSGHYRTGLQREKLWNIAEVIEAAKRAKEKGATRYCMGAAWRRPPKKELPNVIEMIQEVKKLGLETCVTLGSLDAEDAAQLKAAGLDFYNHNLDTSRNYYEKIITTHRFEDRLETLNHVSNAGINVCCGGIIGMGETHQDRVQLLVQLANLPDPPKSVPINRHSRVKGTPLENADTIDNFEFIRTIAIARIMMPTSVIRLSAGRVDMSEEMQALCMMAGANSMWLGEKLLTTENPDSEKDFVMLQKLGMVAKKSQHETTHASS